MTGLGERRQPHSAIFFPRLIAYDYAPQDHSPDRWDALAELRDISSLFRVLGAYPKAVN